MQLSSAGWPFSSYLALLLPGQSFVVVTGRLVMRNILQKWLRLLVKMRGPVEWARCVGQSSGPDAWASRASNTTQVFAAVQGWIKLRNCN